MLKWFLLSGWLSSLLFYRYRGAVQGPWKKVFFDHSVLLAPLNTLLVLFSRVPRTPFVPLSALPELKPLLDNWQVFAREAKALQEAKRIAAATGHNDIGFNSFFKYGWKRFYLKWYEVQHPSATELCPESVRILRSIPSVKAAMFAELPPGGKLNPHRDPYAGSLRFHMGLITPNSDDCWIKVDGQTYSWRDGEATVFDETYIHEARNDSSETRVILFCDIERPVHTGLLRWINQAFARHVMSAASSPNQTDEQPGLINRLAHLQWQLEEQRKRLKNWNRTVYRLVKLLLVAALVAAFVWL